MSTSLKTTVWGRINCTKVSTGERKGGAYVIHNSIRKKEYQVTEVFELPTIRLIKQSKP